MYRGRELSRIDLGLDVLNRVIDMLWLTCQKLKSMGTLEGRRHDDRFDW